MTNDTAPRRWQIPVLDPRLRLQWFVLYAARGNVVMVNPPGTAWVVPPNADRLICEALRQAREAAERDQDQEPVFTPPDDLDDDA